MQTQVVDVQGLHLHKVQEPDRTEFLKLSLRHVTEDISLFPGPQPCSLERNDYPKLKLQPYMISEKTDGFRMAVLCARYKELDVICMADRLLNLYLLPIRRWPTQLFQGTIMDGELCKNRQTGGMMLMLFDAVLLASVAVYVETFSERLNLMAMAMERYEPDDSDPLAVGIKPFVSSALPPAEIKRHLESTKKTFDADGVVFYPDNEPIVFGRHRTLFKWKEAHTIDFLVGENRKLKVYDRYKRTNVDVATLCDDDGGDEPPPGCVVECECVNLERSVWRVVCARPDKTRANDMMTYERTMGNIRERLTLDDVLAQL